MAETPALMYMLATILTVLALIATVLRFYARYIKKAGFSWDDYLIVPAILFTFGTAMGMIIGEHMTFLSPWSNSFDDQSQAPLRAILHDTRSLGTMATQYLLTVP